MEAPHDDHDRTSCRPAGGAGPARGGHPRALGAQQPAVAVRGGPAPDHRARRPRTPAAGGRRPGPVPARQLRGRGDEPEGRRRAPRLPPAGADPPGDRRPDARGDPRRRPPAPAGRAPGGPVPGGRGAADQPLPVRGPPGAPVGAGRDDRGRRARARDAAGLRRRCGGRPRRRADPHRRAGRHCDLPDAAGERADWVGRNREGEGIPADSLGPRPVKHPGPHRDLAPGPTRSARRVPFETTPTIAVLSTLHDKPADWGARGWPWSGPCWC